MTITDPSIALGDGVYVVVRACRGKGPFVVVAQGVVTLPAGRARIVTLRLTPAGRGLLGALGRRREAGIMAVSLDGASPTRHVLVV